MIDERNSISMTQIEISKNHEYEFCVYCGKQIKKTSKFCCYCGNKKIEDEVFNYIIANFTKEQKVKAIQYYRQQTGASLKEGNDMIEKIFNMI